MNIEKRFNDLGYAKIKENEYGCSYVKIESKDYRHIIEIDRKETGKHLIFSYDEKINKDKLNNVVGLTELEMKVAIKKLQQMKRKYHWS